MHKERNRVAYQPLEQGKTCDVHGWGLRVSSTKVESSFPPAMYPVLSQLRRWCHLDAECRVMLDNYDIRWVLPFLFLDIQIQIKTHIQIGKHIMRDNCDIRWVLLCWQTNCWWELSLTRAILRSNEQMFHPHSLRSLIHSQTRSIWSSSRWNPIFKFHFSSSSSTFLQLCFQTLSSTF